MPQVREIWCCFKKRLMTVAAIAAALTAILVAANQMEQYRWWVWASEFRVVAGRVYEASIPEQLSVISIINRQLERAKSIPPERRSFADDAKINNLESAKHEATQKLNELLGERNRYTNSGAMPGF